MPILMTPDLARIQSKLDRWELDHLRELAADLAERLQAAEARADYAEQTAEYWRESLMSVEDVQLTLSMDGSIGAEAKH